MARQAYEILDTGPRIAMGLLGCLHDLEPMLRIPHIPPLTFRRASQCGCEIPPPCWAPQQLEEKCSQVCPGGTATLRFRITNCGATERNFTIEGAPIIVPASISLGSQERGYCVVSATVPPEAYYGYKNEYLVWIRGCRNHYVRWTVMASKHQDCECQEICVEDCPDPIHHWYDHFYCSRPCVRD
jgi:hypothetical protein